MNKMIKNYNKCKRLIWLMFNVEENEFLFKKIILISGIMNVFFFRVIQCYCLGLFYYKMIFFFLFIEYYDCLYLCLQLFNLGKFLGRRFIGRRFVNLYLWNG